MSLLLLSMDTSEIGLVVIGELINANLISGYNDKMVKDNHLRIIFNDNNILEFINNWIYLHSMKPVNQKSIKNIYLCNYLDKSTTLLIACNPIILKNEKDWSGNLISENVARFDYDSINDFKSTIRVFSPSIDSIITIWNRDKKINQILVK